MKKIILFLILFVFSVQAFSQKQGQTLIDSLLASISFQSNDTVKAKIYNRAGLFYMNINLDSSYKYAKTGMLLAQHMQWDKGISAFHTIYGNILYRKGKIDSASKEYQQALSHSSKIKDSINIAGAYINLGAVANGKSDYITAASYYMRALEISKAMKNYLNAGMACENLALVYQYQEDYTKGLEYAKQSIATYELTNDRSYYPSPLGLIGSFFMKMRRYDSAFYYFQKAIAVSREVNNELMEGTLYNSLSQFYAEKQEYENAIQTALQGKKIFDKIGPSYEDAITNKGLLGSYYLESALESSNKNDARKKLLKIAHGYLTEAVQKFKQANNKSEQAEFQKSLAEADAMTGDYKNAFLNYKNYKEINDSIFSQENKNKIAAIETRNEIARKNLEIERQKLKVNEQKKNTFILLLGLLFMTAIGILFYRISMVRKQKNQELVILNKELENANKLKAKFFGILSHDLRSPIANLVNFLNLRISDPDAMSKEQVAEREKKIGTSAQTLLETMESMLLWSKSQMQQFKPEKKSVSIEDIFAYLKSMFATNENISFTFFCNEENLMIETDEDYLKAIIQNLTTNAVKAVKNIDPAKIEWVAGRTENNKCFLSIKDNGPGINSDNIKALFDETETTSVKHGLGLHIIRDLAKAIHCTIQVVPGIDKGTGFILSF